MKIVKILCYIGLCILKLHWYRYRYALQVSVEALLGQVAAPPSQFIAILFNSLKKALSWYGSDVQVSVFNTNFPKISGIYLPQRSCGKVMFSQACVKILSMGGHACHAPPPPTMHALPCHTPPLPHMPPPPTMHAPLPCMHPLPCTPPTMHAPHHPCPPPLPGTMRCGQWSGGTHPTGMHSCCI